MIVPAQRAVIAAIVAAVLIGVPVRVIRAQSLPLVTAGSLTYGGAFRVPAGFDYGGTSPAFNPARNSLYLVPGGSQQLAEISIPEVRAGSIAQLDRATFVQSISDPTEGRLRTLANSEVRIGGVLAYGGQLFVTGYQYYDADQTQRLSHFVRSPDLSANGSVRGPYAVGSVGTGFTSGYFGIVPPEWRSAFGAPVLNGQCCLPIITRTSFGPALFALEPSNFGAARSPIPAIPLVYYPSSNPTIGGYNTTGTIFNGTTSITGVVFPNGTRSVLFFGTQGLGEFCYGTGEKCNDPLSPYQGNHGYPYQNQVWAYDANDLLRVRRGQVKPWAIRPYATWRLDLPFADARGQLYGATYDPATGRIFISAGSSDADAPLIHVFKVGGATTP